MYHELFHNFKEMWMGNLIGEFSRNNVVHSLRSRNARGAFQEDDQMCVRESSLLILDHVYISFSCTENAFLHNVIQNAFEFQVEHLSDNVGSVMRRLIWKQRLSHLSPLWICHHSNEEIGSSKSP